MIRPCSHDGVSHTKFRVQTAVPEQGCVYCGAFILYRTESQTWVTRIEWHHTSRARCVNVVPSSLPGRSTDLRDARLESMFAG